MFNKIIYLIEIVVEIRKKIELDILTFDQVKMLELKVSDTGLGIEDKEIPYLFKMFRMSTQLKNKYNCRGTGIGLTISKKLVESLGGNISLSSKIDKGTEVTFTVCDQKPLLEIAEENKSFDPLPSEYNQFALQSNSSAHYTENLVQNAIRISQPKKCDLSIRQNFSK